MKSKQVALVLAGTVPHIDLISKLKHRGFHTILVDYASNPPAKEYADDHIVESALDVQVVYKLAIKTKASLVISVAGEGYIVACKVSEMLDLPAPYNFETASSFSDKVLMKEKMLGAGIPTASFQVVDSSDLSKGLDLRYPVVVKPVDSYGSKGVRVLYSKEKINLYVHEAIKFSKHQKAIIEEYKQGVEISAYGFISNDRADILQVSQKFIIDTGEASVMQNVGTLSPADISPQAFDSLVSIANKIPSCFRIDNSPFLIQAIIDKVDNIFVIEIEPRLGGGLSYKVVEERTGFDLMNASINSYLGIQTNVVIRESDWHHLIVNIFSKPGVFNTIIGHETLIDDKVIDNIYFNKLAGAIVNPEMSSSDRVGKFIIKSKEKQDVAKRFKRAIAELEVLDMTGNCVMRKDIYRNLVL